MQALALPLSCTIQRPEQGLPLHLLHSYSKRPDCSALLHCPVLPPCCSIQMPAPSLLRHLCHEYSSHPVFSVPPHSSALPPYGTVLRPLPRPCRRRRRPHSTHPAHTVLPGIPAPPLWCTTSQPPHCTRVPHTAARSYTGPSHFPESPPLRTICGPLCRPFQRPEPDNSTRPVRTVPRHCPALRPFCTTRPHFLRFFSTPMPF